MRLSKLLLVVLAISLSATSQASAATITDLVTFSATEFTVSSGDPAGTTVPVSPVTGSFTITFDPTQNYSSLFTGNTSGITLNSLNITLDSSLSFSYGATANYLYAGSPAGDLWVGGGNDGPGVVIVSPPTNDFYLRIDNFTTTPTFGQLGYSQTQGATAGYQYYFYTTSADGDSVSVTPVVPEPSTMLLIGSGLLGLGAFKFRKKLKG